MIVDYLKEFGSASRKELDNLIMPQLSDALSREQKDAKVHNLVSDLRRKGLIRNVGSRRKSKWLLLDGNILAPRNN